MAAAIGHAVAAGISEPLTDRQSTVQAPPPRPPDPSTAAPSPSPSPAPAVLGSTVTFYSYKGGTGRTMALANTACVLAEREQGAADAVLVVDWDLEAPGLHRFFPPRLRTADAALDLGLDDQPGLIDLFIALSDALPAAVMPTGALPEDALPSDASAAEAAADQAARQAVNALPLAHYITPTEVAGIGMLRAGRNDDDGYSRRVNTFDWESLFRRAPTIYRRLAERLAAHSRWVLIDSRTGVTDISGICTSLMPEKLVVVFTPNRQSLTGVRELVSRATAYRLASDDLRPLRVFPLASRIETSLERLSLQWRHGHPDAGIVGYQPMFEHLLAECYGLARCDLKAYFDAVFIQQKPECAYGEVISVRDGAEDRASLASSYRVFVERLVARQAPWEDATAWAAAQAEALPVRPLPMSPLPSKPLQVTPTQVTPTQVTPLPLPIPASAADGLADPVDPARPPPGVTAPPHTGLRPSLPASGARIFFSWAAADHGRVALVADALQARGHSVSWDRHIPAGETFTTVITRALDASDVVLVFWSRASVESKWVQAEVMEGLRRGVLVPVLLDDVLPPLAFRSILAFDFSRAGGDDLARLVETVEQTAARRPGDPALVYALHIPPPAPAAPAPPIAYPAAPQRPSAVQPAATPGTPGRRLWLLVVLGLVAVGGIAVVYTRGSADKPAVPVAAAPAPDMPLSSPLSSPPAMRAASSRAAAVRGVTVPALVDLRTDQAETAATAVGLAVQMFDPKTGATQKYLEGIVKSQNPAARSEAPAGSVVRLTVATDTVQVPALGGISLGDALARLRANRLALGKIDPVEGSQLKPGTVVRQTPQAGEPWPAGAQVNVGVAAEATTTPTPTRPIRPRAESKAQASPAQKP